jgi:LEA14-like dessication related protein
MKKVFQNIGVVAVVLAGLGFVVYRLSKKIWVEKSSLRNLRPTIDSLMGTVVMRVKNTSNTQLSIHSFEGELLYNGVSLADLYVGPQIIRANSVTEIPIQFRALYTEIPNSISQIFRQQLFYPQFSIKGNLYAAGLRIPVKSPLWLV